MNKNWNDEMISDLYRYFPNESKEFLENHFNKKYDSIRKKANSLNIKRKAIYQYTKREKINQQKRKNIDIDYVIEMNNEINRMSIIQISKNLNVSKTTIRRRLQEIKHPINVYPENVGYKKYSEDDNYFEIIDSEEKAYFLGFIFADGYISKIKKGYCLGIHIHKNDIEVLHNFQKSIKSDGIINITNGEYALLRIHNKKLINDIEKLGCVIQKSLILKFPIIEEEFINHFMRGYFDGDGSIRYLKNKIRRTSTGIVSSHIFCAEYMEFLHKYANTNIVKVYSRGNSSSLDYSGRGNATKIYNFLYKNATVFLTRKKLKFEEVIYKDGREL